jgi:hypothetical protein
MGVVAFQPLRWPHRSHRATAIPELSSRPLVRLTSPEQPHHPSDQKHNCRHRNPNFTSRDPICCRQFTPSSVTKRGVVSHRRLASMSGILDTRLPCGENCRALSSWKQGSGLAGRSFDPFLPDSEAVSIWGKPERVHLGPWWCVRSGHYQALRASPGPGMMRVRCVAGLRRPEE